VVRVLAAVFPVVLGDVQLRPGERSGQRVVHQPLPVLQAVDRIRWQRQACILLDRNSFIFFVMYGKFYLLLFFIFHKKFSPPTLRGRDATVETLFLPQYSSPPSPPCISASSCAIMSCIDFLASFLSTYASYSCL
jgi:hypothetical protein